MASNRIGRINEEIQRELAQQLRLLKDPRVQKTMVSITHVETTPDLRYAKVYVSLLDRSCRLLPSARRRKPPEDFSPASTSLVQLRSSSET